MSKLKIKTIDSHTHVTKWFGKNQEDYITLFNRLQENLGLAGLAIASVSAEENMLASIYKLHNPNAYAYANIVLENIPAYPPFSEGMDSLTQYNELMDLGFDGIKILYKPNHQKKIKLKINDEYYEPFFSQAEKDGTNILWHTADPEFFWDQTFDGKWSYKDGTYPGYEEMLEETLDVLKRHPELNITFAHFLFMSENTKRLSSLLDNYNNVKIDITPGTEMFLSFSKDPEYFREFFSKYKDRIIFGSDSTIPAEPTEDYEYENNEDLVRDVYDALVTDKDLSLYKFPIKGLCLPEEILKKILYDNFIKACKDKPSPIDKTALKKYISKYESKISSSSSYEPIMEFCKKL